MAKPSKAVLDFMAAHNIDSDEVWEVRGTAWVVKHKALERVAVELGIVWDKPELKVCDITGGCVVVLISGTLGGRTEFSFGEASPKNNKNGYPVAMAEKRAKDRVILKLLVCHGDLYSSADDIPDPDELGPSKRANPHKTTAEDIYDGELSDDVPTIEESGSPRQNKFDSSILKVAEARPMYEALIKEMARHQDAGELKEWVNTQEVAAIIKSLPGEWPKIFSGKYTEHKQSIMNGAA